MMNVGLKSFGQMTLLFVVAMLQVFSNYQLLLQNTLSINTVCEVLESTLHSSHSSHSQPNTLGIFECVLYDIIVDMLRTLVLAVVYAIIYTLDFQCVSDSLSYLYNFCTYNLVNKIIVHYYCHLCGSEWSCFSTIETEQAFTIRHYYPFPDGHL